MKLFTDEIIEQLINQYSFGGELKNQQVICKIFNRCGEPSLWTWHLVLYQYGCRAMDPEDGDYIWRPSHGV
ncbi:MAG: hypothetical protein RIG62_24050 [Cyclobacteriaceae bacterium]